MVIITLIGQKALWVPQSVHPKNVHSGSFYLVVPYSVLSHKNMTGAVIHLPARSASQTHKFLRGHANLVPHASIWTQKMTIKIIAYVLYSVDRASDRIRPNTTAYFANICICIIRPFFHIKQEVYHISEKQLPYNPKRKNSELNGYFEEVLLLKQRQKHASSFVTNF